ncbi:DUF5060 domain-containing protein [Haloferula rosea]|uniref:DUF5060 domain-containing protein n=1 Tax=Haloferula rosea TaxID=490093 RepID=A0A934VDX3_9BACT|nr:DUF5060 domain-containing protein [Haloferula rosea]MBK1825466.1 DUF5060 domain-containing protein [Haloferula rosea]
MKRFVVTLLSTAAIASAQVYNESGGLVVMEIENTASPLGLWQEQSSLSGYSGDGYLQFLGNSYETGPATSPLEFNFTINQSGLYYLHLHCAKETHDGRTDVANDCYVRVEGDYNAGPGPHDGHGDNASLSVLKNNTKYFGGATNSWKWENGQNSSGGAGNLDPGGHANKRVAVYDFKAGETYKLVVSGRSKFFRINRIVFRHTSTSQSVAQNLSTPESDTTGGGETCYVYDATSDFPDITSGDVDYYADNGNDALAIAANIVENRTGFARASRAFDGPTGTYDVTITTMTEEDGESTYHLLVNGVQVATYTNPYVFVEQGNSPLDLQPHTHTWSGISIPNGATIAIESNADTNGEIPENGGTAWARGRWQQIEICSSTSLVRPPAGRIAYVADGNSPDPDDIGANAVVFGLLDGAGLQDRLVHFSHSCDLNPLATGGSQSIDASNEQRRQNYLHQTAGEGIAHFGPFPNLTDYYNCRSEQSAAVNDLRDAINASSAGDPLWIIEAGEPDIIGYALDAATPSKRQFVHAISHHPANDNSGDFYTWAQILAFGVTEHQIGDQNVGLQVQISSGLWDWAEGHSDPAMVWILDQLKYAEADGVVGFQDNKYDCSDAGMIYWWITGANAGGNRNSTPVEIKDMLLYEGAPGPVDPLRPVGHWKLDEGTGTAAVDSSDFGNDGTLLNGVSWGSDGTRGTYAQFDGSDDRIATPFRYALSSSDDFTWAWWAKVEPGNSTGAIMVGNRYGGTGSENLEFIKLMQHEAQLANSDSAGSIEKYNYADLPTDQWHHYAMVKSGTSYQWYVDGVAQGAPQTFSYSESSSIPFLIGGDDDGSGTKVNEHFEGCIDDVVLYRRALTPAELVDVQNGIYFPAPPSIEILAGWDSWDSDSAPSATVTAAGVSASATASAESGASSWSTSDSSGDPGRGSSDDGTWGGFDEDVSASTVTNVHGSNMTLTNAKTDGEITLTITNNGASDIELNGFHFDAVAFRPKAARAYALSVLAGSDISVGNVFTSADDVITDLEGGLSGHNQHDQIDLDLSGLADATLEVGGTAVLQLTFSSGAGDGSGGHHLFVDNVAITHAVASTPVNAPQVNAGSDVSVTLPVNQANLVGTATDNGTVVSTVWTQESGPGTATLSGENSLNLTASDLVQGSYVFRLTATDDESNSSFDEVTVNVLPVGGGTAAITGELKKWHKVTFSWNGPSSSETAGTNPFSDYRLNVTFSHAGSGKSYTVPGYFAADGNAAETSADSGNVWRAHFAPDEEGEWSYSASFRTGSDVAVSSAIGAGSSAGFFDGDGGLFTIGGTDKTGRDLRGKGRLQYVGKHHLQFAETGEYFLKAGPDAPENFLAYDDFDDTPNDQDNQPNNRKSWGPHAGDYDAASASPFTWQSGKGTEILGAVRYLAEKGLNSFSFLTFNVDGDDDNVFPHRLRSTVSAYEGVADNARWANANGVFHDRFDVSKMAQWERVFEYGTQQGMYLHFKTQETENDDRMDGGGLGRERTLYYRELVARFGHHLALNWNLGEENTNTTAQQQDFAQWFHDNDPYQHNVVLHTYPWQKDAVYTPLLGTASKLTGLSLQTNQADFTNVFPDTLAWVKNSAGAGVPWVVACDEPGDAQHALRPAGDAGSSWTDGRKNALWGNVMAGGAGVEFYFGYQHANSDLTCQDYASRDGFWDYCRYMIEFFENNEVPFQDMANEDALVSNSGAWCLRKTGTDYVIYLKNGGTTNLDLSAASGDFDVRWYDPRNGGVLQQGSVVSVNGGGAVSLGTAPSANTSDWVVLVSNGAGGGNTLNGEMPGLEEDADVRNDSVVVNLGADSLVPGKSGGGGGFDRATIFVFQLPDLGMIDDPFLAATLSFNVVDVSTSPPGVDLYGLGRRVLPDVLAGDYYGENGTPDPTDADLIQSNILTSSTGTGAVSSSASSALAAYLNAQYDGGNGVGKYVFLRLSTNGVISGLQRHFVTSADAPGGAGPRISFSAIEESDSAVSQDFSDWLAGFSFPPGADLNPDGDPDLDGRTTEFEYLFGLDPSDGASTHPFVSFPEPIGGTFRYTRRNPALTGVTDYQVWMSNDLSGWSRDATATQTVVVDADVQEVEVTLSGPKPLAAPRLFAQIRVGE